MNLVETVVIVPLLQQKPKKRFLLLREPQDWFLFMSPK